MGDEGGLERGKRGKLFERPNDCRIRSGHLERAAMPSFIEQLLPAISSRAGLPAPKEMLVDVAQLETDYYAREPDLDDPHQLVSFGTSGHRGSSLRGTFTE